MDNYICKECNKPVIVKNEVIIKTCEHKNAPVIAIMTAITTGESKIK